MEQGDRLGELDLIGARIDHEKEIPLVDNLPILEMDLGKSASDLRTQLDAVDRRKLADLLTTAAIARHTYLRALLGELDRGPIFCPELTESQMGQKLGTAHWAGWAAEHITRSDPLARVGRESSW